MISKKTWKLKHEKYETMDFFYFFVWGIHKFFEQNYMEMRKYRHSNHVLSSNTGVRRGGEIIEDRMSTKSKKCIIN